MKISKKLAKEILVGNFENVDLDTLQKCSRARTNKFEYINLKVSKELKKEIIAREIEKLGFTIKGGN